MRQTALIVFCCVFSLLSCVEEPVDVSTALSTVIDAPFVTAAAERRKPGIPPLFMGWLEVQRTARLINAGRQPWMGEWKSIKAAADERINAARDPHPYIRVPGEAAYDADRFVDLWLKAQKGNSWVADGDDVWALAHAWIFDGNTAYCSAAARILRSWADNTLLHGIGEFTQPEAHNIGLPIAHALTQAVFSYELLSGCLSQDDKNAILAWFGRGKDIVLTSHTNEAWKNLEDEFNNHLSFDNLYFGVYGFLTNNAALVNYAIGPTVKPASCSVRWQHSTTCNMYDWKRMVQGAIFDGHTPNEYLSNVWGDRQILASTGQIWDAYRHFAPVPKQGETPEKFHYQGFYYSNYHLYALTMLAEAAYHRGYPEDLYRWTAQPTGENLQMAYLPLARMMRDTQDVEVCPQPIDNEYARHVVGFVGQSADDVKVYYDDNYGSRGRWDDIKTLQSRRAIAYPTNLNAKDVAGFARVGPSSSDDVATYFTNGLFVKGNWVQLQIGTSLPQPYTRVDSAVGSIVGIQGGSQTDVKAYYAGGVASRGDMEHLNSHPTDSLRTVSYPQGYGPDDVAGFASSDSSDDVFTYFKDGLVSEGTWVGLGSIKKPYKIDSYYADDIPGNEVFWGETVDSAYRGWLEAPLARWGGADYELARATCAFEPYNVYGGARRYDPFYRILTAFHNGITYDDIGWDFDYGADGWTPGENGHATFTLSNNPSEEGSVLVTSSGGDPWMTSPEIRIFPSAALAASTGWQFTKALPGPESRCKSEGVEQLVYTKIALELSGPTPLPNNQVSVFWDNGGGFNSTNSINFPAAVGGTTPQRFVKDLSSYPSWTAGVIKRLRVDPMSTASTKVRVHSIRLLR